MKILNLIQSLPGEIGASGAEKLGTELALTISSDENYKLFASTSNAKTWHGIENIKVRISKNKLTRKLLLDYINPLVSRDLHSIIREYKIDLVHVHTLYGVSLFAIREISKKVPVLITAHDYWPICYWATMMRGNKRCNYCHAREIRSISDVLHYIHSKLSRYFLQNVQFVAPSKYMMKMLKMYGDFNSVLQIPNGIDMPNSESRGERGIIWCGRLEPEKGLDSIAGDLDKLAVESNISITILGDGSQKTELKEKYTNLQFVGKVNPSQYYEKYSILVMSSQWPENLPYTLLESMSYGMIAIAPKVGGIPEIIEDGVNGLLYENIKDFKKVLKKAMEMSDQEKRAMGQKAIEKIRNKFSLEKTAQKYEELYKELIKNFRPSHLQTNANS